ncbi:MAG: transposase, partial [Bryocella sp.]
MKEKRFSVEQIVGVLKQVQVGVPVAEVIRKAEISEQTFYRWKAKYAGLETVMCKICFSAGNTQSIRHFQTISGPSRMTTHGCGVTRDLRWLQKAKAKKICRNR